MAALVETDRKEASIPPEAVGAIALARECLGASLVAAYLHGSAVAGGLRPDSDVDILAIIDQPLADEPQRRLLAGLMNISGHPVRSDPRRPLELIIFTTADLAHLSYPARSEFVYGEWLRAAFEGGSIPQPEANPEFTVLIAAARQAALVLAGPAPEDLLPAISDRDLRRAMGDSLGGLRASLIGDERNVLLTLVRILCTLETGRIVPKDTAADWALERFSGRTARLIGKARRGYLGEVEDDWSDCRADVEMVTGDLMNRIAILA